MTDAPDSLHATRSDRGLDPSRSCSSSPSCSPWWWWHSPRTRATLKSRPGGRTFIGPPRQRQRSHGQPLEDLERGVGPCLLFGQDYNVTDTVNDLTPEVDCTWVGGRFNVGDLFAVVMTGAGTGPHWSAARHHQRWQLGQCTEDVRRPGVHGGAATPSGADPTLDFKATLSIKNADLSYSAADCGTATPSFAGGVVDLPVGYGTQCYGEPWDASDMFGGFIPAEPGIPIPPTSPSSRPRRRHRRLRMSDLGARSYTSPPNLANQSYNYFKLRRLLLQQHRNWGISSAFTLFGYPGGTGSGIDGFKPNDTFANNPCSNAWTTDPKLSGASSTSVATPRSPRPELDVRGLGRERSGQNIAIQALAPAAPAATRARSRATRRSSGPDPARTSRCRSRGSCGHHTPPSSST